MTLLGRYRGIVCDLDGVVYRGPQAIPVAVEVLNRLAVPVVFATNNASRTPEAVSDHLRELGLDARAGDVVTSSQAGAALVREKVGLGAPVLAVGGPGVSDALAAEGLSLASSASEAVAVLQGYGAEVTAADLAEAAYAVQGGALWVATNTDRTLPTDRGLAPGNGSLVAAVGFATDTDPVVVGKPEAPMYLLCASRLGAAAASLLAVGDRLDTDVAGATAAGMDSALVLTGVDGLAAAAAAPAALRPTYLLIDLRGLTEPYDVPHREGATWRCGEARVSLSDDGAVWVEQPGAGLEAGRAAVAALQDAVDSGSLDARAAAAAMSRFPFPQ